MGLDAELPSQIDSVDIVVAGGGTAGCIVASRLAAASPSLSILVIEAGPDGAGNPAVDYPALFLGNLTPASTTAAFFKSNKASSLADRELVVPAAHVLGGGSAVNMMQYSRAQRTDWNSWNVPGWNTDELMPYLKKLESYHGPGQTECHGTDGPIEISPGTYSSPRLQDQFISALAELGWPEVQDLASTDTCNGVQRSLRYVSRDGKRQDTATHKATGVVFKSKADGSVERTILARKQIVLSAGAFGSSAILERSGIGHADVLKRVGITQVVHLPGVGDAYQDHNMMVYPFLSALEPDETLDALLAGRKDVVELIKDNHGILGWNAQEATAKLRAHEEDVGCFSPELKKLWDDEYRDNQNKPLMMMALVCAFPGEPTGIPAEQYFAISVFTVYPLSRGHLHITGPEPDDPVEFDTGFLSDAKGIDVQKHRWAYKKQREIARRMPVFRGEFAPGHPAFDAGSGAASVSLTGPPSGNLRDIEYSTEDDAVIDKFVRENVGSAWHSLGTCKMGRQEENAVVDANLGVYGVQGLKIADLSVIPNNVAANTNHTAMVVGEKAADIIIRELGL